MKGNLVSKTSLDDDLIDIKNIILILWKEKLTVIVLTFLFSVLVVIYSLLLPNIYTSKALVLPSSNQSEVGSAFGRYSALASLSGVSLPSLSVSSTDEALVMLSSYKFFSESFFETINLPDLMAGGYWDSSSNKMIYDPSIYNEKENTWVREVSLPRNTIPSKQESYRAFIKDFLNISQDMKTSVISISIDHQSPVIAMEWVSKLVNLINKELRDDQTKRSLVSIEYLNQQMALTTYNETRLSLSRLIEQEVEKLMLVEANEEYIFKIIEPPIIPELKSSPSRALICIVGAILGFLISLLIGLVKHSYFNKKV